MKRKKKPTKEIIDEFSSDEVTEVIDALMVELNFNLSERDIRLIQGVADEKGISYEAAMHAVLRDALDLYHWQANRTV